jgi:regulator of protease activity HflC (stomatin/prohibitin superfamily)
MGTGSIIELAVVGLFAILVIYAMISTVRVVPQQSAWIVERLGRYDRTLLGGLQILTPFVDAIRAEIDLREQAVAIAEQDCITKDNVLVQVDGILYYKIVDPERATYGISRLPFAIEQLAQTTLRSEIGKIELDHTFEERPLINANIVAEVDKASEVGRQGAALRDQDDSAASRYPRGDGEADAGGAGETRGRAAIRR